MAFVSSSVSSSSLVIKVEQLMLDVVGRNVSQLEDAAHEGVESWLQTLHDGLQDGFVAS